MTQPFFGWTLNLTVVPLVLYPVNDTHSDLGDSQSPIKIKKNWLKQLRKMFLVSQVQSITINVWRTWEAYNPRGKCIYATACQVPLIDSVKDTRTTRISNWSTLFIQLFGFVGFFSVDLHSIRLLTFEHKETSVNNGKTIYVQVFTKRFKFNWLKQVLFLKLNLQTFKYHCAASEIRAKTMMCDNRKALCYNK